MRRNIYSHIQSSEIMMAASINKKSFENLKNKKPEFLFQNNHGHFTSPYLQQYHNGQT